MITPAALRMQEWRTAGALTRVANSATGPIAAARSRFLCRSERDRTNALRDGPSEGFLHHPDETFHESPRMKGHWKPSGDFLVRARCGHQRRKIECPAGDASGRE